MSIKALSSDRKRHSFLLSFIATAEAEENAGRRLVTPQLINAAKSLQTSFAQHADALQEAHSQRRAAAADRRFKVETLSFTMRDFWNGLQRRARRANRSNWEQSRYKLHISKPISQLSGFQEWTIAARELLAGEAKAVEAGQEPMANPSAETLAADLAAVEAATAAVNGAENELRALREQLKVDRKDTERIHRDIARYIRFSLGDAEPATRRATMRTYGYTITVGSSQTGAETTDGEPAGGIGTGTGDDGATTGTDEGTTGTGDGAGNNGTTGDNNGGAGTEDGGTGTGTIDGGTGSGGGSGSGGGNGGAGAGTGDGSGGGNGGAGAGTGDGSGTTGDGGSGDGSSGTNGGAVTSGTGGSGSNLAASSIRT